MKRRVLFVFAVLVLTGVLPSQSLGRQVRVTGDSVNLRVGPDMNTKVIAQVSKGDLLAVGGRLEGNWVQVVPPEGVHVWVYGQLLKDGVVAVSKLKVRAGPGINYRTLGVLREGDTVTVRGEWKGWTKISPPEGCYVWISGDYVETVDLKVEEANAKKQVIPEQESEPVVVKETPKAGPVQAVDRKPPMPAPVTRPVPRRQPIEKRDKTEKLEPAPKANVKAPDALGSRKLVGGIVQGEETRQAGYLRHSGLILKRPSKYRLARQDERGRVVTTHYVLGNDAVLNDLLGREIEIKGRQYWLQGIRYPVLVVDHIRTRPRGE